MREASGAVADVPADREIPETESLKVYVTDAAGP